jgi:hypothetical protein
MEELYNTKNEYGRAYFLAMTETEIDDLLSFDYISEDINLYMRIDKFIKECM